MEPRSEYEVLAANAAKTFHFSAAHIASERNTFCRVLTHGPASQNYHAGEIQSHTGNKNLLKFDFRSKTRNSPEMVRALYNVIEEFKRNMGENLKTAGLVVFFPSFDYLSSFYSQCYKRSNCGSSSSSAESAAGQKGKFFRLFHEERGGNVSSLLQSFEKSTTECIAILFAVVGGKVSEGINFRNDMCRCVIVVGLPYPNPQDPVLVEKMKYLDSLVAGKLERRRKLEQEKIPTPSEETQSALGIISSDTKPNNQMENISPLTGKQYYQMKCMKAVNQCIGRAIRHKDDWAGIFLLDHRYGNAGILREISGWLRERFKVEGSDISEGNGGFGKLGEELGAWFRGMRGS